MPLLVGHRVRLFPLEDVPRDALYEAAKPEEVWRLMPKPIGIREVFDAYIDDALATIAAGTAEVFAIESDGRFVGSTRLTGIDREHRKAELGYTWHHPSVWRTYVNTEAKRLMLGHAFDGHGLIRVYFFIDVRNERSQRAVERLGAVREGVLRNERILHDGYVRSTAVYSILAEEWPEICERLDARISL